jgi:hypothetical protein
MTPREQNRLNRENHERVEIFDWALDIDLNEVFTKWAEELRRALESDED